MIKIDCKIHWNRVLSNKTLQVSDPLYPVVFARHEKKVIFLYHVVG